MSVLEIRNKKNKNMGFSLFLFFTFSYQMIEY